MLQEFRILELKHQKKRNKIFFVGCFFKINPSQSLEI